MAWRRIMDVEIVNRVINIIKDEYGAEPYAALTYGSRIAGYAKETSDYDFLCIIDGLKEGIRYLYRKVGDLNIYFSLLLVDKNLFERDADEAYLGEFVIGRLLSIYIPIINEEYIDDIEIRYKRRVIIEELSLLYGEFKDLLFNLNIPLKYILFSRLKRRLSIYPHVKYSYIKTYYGPNGIKNLSWAVGKFREAANTLAKEGIIELNGNIIKVKEIAEKKLLLIDMIIRGVKSYIVHGWSARVPLKVFGEELGSKIKRGIETLRAPNEMLNPHVLLEAEGVPFSISKQSIPEIIQCMYGGSARILKIKRGGLFSPLYILTINRNGERIRTVVKCFSLLWILKWIFIQLWILDIKRFTLSPRKRLINEFRGFMMMPKVAPLDPVRPLLLDWGGKRIFIEYKSGEKLSNIIFRLDLDKAKKLLYSYGYILANIHNQGYTIGDTKPQNVIVRDGKLTIIDLEQWGTDNKSWDISLFLFYMFKFKVKIENLEDLIKAFIKGYMDGGGQYIDIIEATKMRYLRVFFILVNPIILFKVRRLINSLIHQHYSPKLSWFNPPF